MFDVLFYIIYAYKVCQLNCKTERGREKDKSAGVTSERATKMKSAMTVIPVSRWLSARLRFAALRDKDNTAISQSIEPLSYSIHSDKNFCLGSLQWVTDNGYSLSHERKTKPTRIDAGTLMEKCTDSCCTLTSTHTRTHTHTRADADNTCCLLLVNCVVCFVSFL